MTLGWSCPLCLWQNVIGLRGPPDPSEFWTCTHTLLRLAGFKSEGWCFCSRSHSRALIPPVCHRLAFRLRRCFLHLCGPALGMWVCASPQASHCLVFPFAQCPWYRWPNPPVFSVMPHAPAVSHIRASLVPELLALLVSHVQAALCPGPAWGCPWTSLCCPPEDTRLLEPPFAAFLAWEVHCVET